MMTDTATDRVGQSEYLSDEKVAELVRDTLANDEDVHASVVCAVVTQGQVTLYGRVRDDDERAAVERVASSSSGVRNVRNLLVADPDGQQEDLRRYDQLSSGLREHDEIDASEVYVSVADQQVLLFGQVDNVEQRRQVERVARFDHNAMYVRNELQVRSCGSQGAKGNTPAQGRETVKGRI